MTFNKHDTINFSQHKTRPITKIHPENIKWDDGNVKVTDIKWTVLILEPSIGLPTYSTNVIDFSDGKVCESDVQWPDKNEHSDNNDDPHKLSKPINGEIEFKEMSTHQLSKPINGEVEFKEMSTHQLSKPINDEIEQLSKPINDEIEQLSKPINEQLSKPINEQLSKPVNEQLSKPVNEQLSKPINGEIEKLSKPIDGEIEQLSKPINGEIEQLSKPINEQLSKPINGEIEFKETCIHQLSKPINGEIEQLSKPINSEIEFKEICTQAESYNSIDELYGGLGNLDYSESCADGNEVYQWGESGGFKTPNHVNEVDSESSNMLQSKDTPDQNDSCVRYGFNTNYTVPPYPRRRRRPRSYLEQRKDPRYNPETDHWKSDAAFLSFHDQERIDPLKRENEKYDAVIQAALDAWSANKDVTMEVFKTKPRKSINSVIFEDDDRGDVIPPVVTCDQTLPPKEISISKSLTTSSQMYQVVPSSSQSIVLKQHSQTYQVVPSSSRSIVLKQHSQTYQAVPSSSQSVVLRQQNTISPLPFMINGQSYVSPLYQALYEGNIYQANS
ncbi:9099_t:CDS:1, partial [Scutellospora calospora]